MTKVERLIYRSKPYRSLYRVLDKVCLPGFDGFSITQISVFFFQQIRSTKMNERVAAVTYNFLMAIPPTLLFLFSLVPYLPLGDVQETILRNIALVIPNEGLRDSFSSVIVNFMNNERKDLLSFGILLTLFFSSNGMMGLMRSFDRSLKVYKDRTGLKRRWTAIKLTFMLLCVVIISFALSIVQTELLNDWILMIFGNLVAVRIVSLLILTIIIFLSISIVYTYGPSLTNRFRFFSAGAVFATILSVVVTSVFFFLVSHFINYNQVYGSIGTLIAFMVWMWLNTLVLLLGYELNVSILLGKISRSEKEENNECKK